MRGKSETCNTYVRFEVTRQEKNRFEFSRTLLQHFAQAEHIGLDF